MWKMIHPPFGGRSPRLPCKKGGDEKRIHCVRGAIGLQGKTWDTDQLRKSPHAEGEGKRENYMSSSEGGKELRRKKDAQRGRGLVEIGREKERD